MKKATLWIIGVTILVIIGGVLLIPGSGSQKSQQSLKGEKISIQGRQHVQEGTDHPAYNSNPPTSGWHYEKAARWGFYEKPLDDERAVHNLEHGGIWISYQPDKVSTSTVAQLKDVADENPQSVIVTLRPKNDTPIALASWGRLKKLESFDRQIIEEFIQANINNSPEPFAG